MGKRRKGHPRGWTRAEVTVHPPSEQIEVARREGERRAEQKTDAAIDQVRADAQALETCALVLARMARKDVPFANPEKVIDGLSAMASGMRLAADRMPDSREIPF